MMIKILAAAAIGAALTITVPPASADPSQDYTPAFTGDGALILPTDLQWREWVFVGAPLTPNALNGGEAPFPEFHAVYIEPKTWAHYQRTGRFMDGAVLAKELSRVRAPDGANSNGSTNEVSGVGYFMGEFSGFEIVMKSRARFPDEPGNWAFFTFGHHAPPYQPAAAAMPTETCNACHQAAAENDYIFTQFYPVLRAAAP